MSFSVLLTAAMFLTGVPVAAESSMPETDSASSQRPSNFWDLLTEDTGSDSASDSGRDNYESGWYTVNKAGDSAEDVSGSSGRPDALSDPDFSEGPSATQAVSAEAGVQDGSPETGTQSGSYYEQPDTGTAGTAVSSGMTQAEYEKALAEAYASGYENGFAAGAEMDTSKLRIRYVGSGLATDPSTFFLSQGLPLLRTPETVAYCYGVLDSFTGEKKLQLYKDGIITDLTPDTSVRTPKRDTAEDALPAVSFSDSNAAASSSETDAVSASSEADPASSSSGDSISSSDSENDTSVSSSAEDVSSSSPEDSTSSSEDDASASSSEVDASASSSEDDAPASASSSEGDAPASSSEDDASASSSEDIVSSSPAEEGVSGSISKRGEAVSSSEIEASSRDKTEEENTEPATLEELTAELQGWIDEAAEADLHLSIMMLDIGTGTILAYNSDEPFYSASSSKAHFIVSLINKEPETIGEYEDTIKNITIDSSNDDYKKLLKIYSLDYYEDWLEAAGVSGDVELDPGGYAFFSAEDLVRLWLLDYLYFEEDKNGQTVGEWFETPNSSAIRATVDEDIVTRTKAGWLVDEEEGYTATADAGVIYEDGHPYIIAILSDYPASMEKLEKYAALLEKIHPLITSADTETIPDTAPTSD